MPFYRPYHLRRTGPSIEPPYTHPIASVVISVSCILLVAAVLIGGVAMFVGVRL